MADVTGTLHHEHGGKTYTLRLTWGVLGALQEKHGDDFLDRLDVPQGKLPPFNLLIDVAAMALAKGEGLKPDDARDLADDIITSDPEVIGRLMAAAFPDAGGNGKAAGKRKR